MKTVALSELKDMYERARAAFSVAHMSNAKWRKVLRALATADIDDLLGYYREIVAFR